jgi:hypothetical protein
MIDDTNNRRKGKIARLPHAMRQRVNALLLDGVEYADIIRQLDEAGFKGINEQNITAWFQGGHKEWLENQRRISDMEFRRDAALEMVKALKREGTVTLADANDLTLASMINETLASYDIGALHVLLQDEPKKFFELAQTINAQSGEQRKREKSALDEAKFQLLLKKAEQADKAKEISQSDLSAEEKSTRMKEVFGIV